MAKSLWDIPNSRRPAGRGGGGLRFFFFRFLDFFFLTAIAFGHIDSLVDVELQLPKFSATLQIQTSSRHIGGGRNAFCDAVSGD
jgi:hypothetical protein